MSAVEKAKIAQEQEKQNEQIYEKITTTLRALISDEIDAVKAYTHLSELYGEFGWRKIFGQILQDEQRHLSELSELLERIKETWIKEREILSI